MRLHEQLMNPMKLSRRYTAALPLALTLGVGACDEGLTEINENPNQPEQISPVYLFPQGVTSAVGLVRGSSFDLTFTGLWAQHYAKIQYVDEDRYEMRPGTIDAYWSAFYSGPLFDLEKTIETANGAAAIAAPARVMRAWTFAQMTDIWGSIPYSEALKGAPGAPVTPAYDPQQVVYTGMLANLTEASGSLSGASNALGSADPIYGGDPAKWRRFANSLRARYGMRLSEVDPAKARAEVTAALEAGGFTSNADNATMLWPGDGTNDAPFYTNFRTRDDHRVSATMVDTLKALTDPRLMVYARPAAATKEYKGVPNGLTNAQALAYGLANTSKIGTFFSQPNSPAYLMVYPELLFIKAEAAQRGWIAGSAAEFYNAGITASMEMFGVSSAEIAAYLAQPRVAYNPATGLQQIALQKWIALFSQGSEAYAEVRRLDMPALKIGPASLTGGVFATRLTYPLSEQATNKASLDAAITAQGDVSLVGKVWWDK